MGNMGKDRTLAQFAGKKVFLTGDTGFKGSWLSFWLHELGAEVMGYSLPPVGNSDLFRTGGLSGLIRHVDGDIRDFEMLERRIQEFQPEFLFHLAAQSLVRPSYESPKYTFDTNVAGSVNVLEAVRSTASIRSVVFVTSDKCYRNKEWVWGYRENDELGGHDPYSASKSAAEIVFSAYLSSFFNKRDHLGTASVRAGNVLGGGDWAADRIVPDCIRALIDRVPIMLRNPEATRPWQHVLEPLYGYLKLASKLYEEPKVYSGAWNFGPGPDSFRTVRELAHKIIDIWGEGEIRMDTQLGQPHESRILHLNCDKAHHLLSWIPSWNFKRSVTEAVEWYRDVHRGEDARERTLFQIRRYMEDRYRD